jgi:hypothetical protein
MLFLLLPCLKNSRLKYAQLKFYVFRVAYAWNWSKNLYWGWMGRKEVPQKLFCAKRYYVHSPLVRPRFCLDWLVPVSQTDSSHAAYSSPWWWRQQGPLKRRYTSTRLHGTTTQKTAIFMPHFTPTPVCRCILLVHFMNNFPSPVLDKGRVYIYNSCDQFLHFFFQ